MINIQNWDSIETVKEYKKFVAGGYVCKITKVTNDAENKKLLVEYDIAEGDFKGEAVNTMERFGFWKFKVVKSYNDKALPFFKRFISAVEQSNPQYKWDGDESKLVGKLVGFVIGEDEYRKQDGTIGTRFSVRKEHSVDDIRGGKFETPTLKELADKPKPKEFTEIEEDDGNLPF